MVNILGIIINILLLQVNSKLLLYNLKLEQSPEFTAILMHSSCEVIIIIIILNLRNFD